MATIITVSENHLQNKYTQYTTKCQKIFLNNTF